MPHFLTECIPIDMSEAEFAPMYFQKAFQEAEGLWATNKAVINTTCPIPLTARHWINERLKGMSGKRKGS